MTRKSLKSQNLHELVNAQRFHLIHFLLGFLSFVFWTFRGGNYFLIVLGGAFFFGFYVLSLKTLKNLYYTFWTLIVITLVFYFTILVNSSHDISSLAIVLAIILLLLESYIISSPLFYPRVSWWEYDFRYRGDVKVKVLHEEKELNARMTDLRRGCGCIVLFEELNLGDEVVVKPEESEDIFHAIILSLREELSGRGIQYGIRFRFDSQKEKRNFLEYSKKWRKRKQIRKRQKFTANGF